MKRYIEYGITAVLGTLNHMEVQLMYKGCVHTNVYKELYIFNVYIPFYVKDDQDVFKPQKI